MQYDAASLLTQSTDSRGKIISYAYDALGRKTGTYDAPAASQSTTNQLASWVYDNANNAITGMTNPIGHATTVTSYNNGGAYVTQEKGWNAFGEPSGETITIPSNTEGTTLGTSYTFAHTYTSTTGLPFRDIYPNAGGLPLETVTHGYAGNLDLPNTLGSGTGYTQGVIHDAPRSAGDDRLRHQRGLPQQHLRRPHRPPHRPAGHPRGRDADQRGRAGLQLRPVRQHHQAGLDPSRRLQPERNPVLHVRHPGPSEPGLDCHRLLRRLTVVGERR